MANKRTLRKHIEYVCGEMAAECIIASNLINGIDRAAMEKLVVSIAMLQESTLNRVGVEFDQNPRAFETPRDYRKARNAYYRAAYRALLDGFRKDVSGIVDEMNKALPRKK